MGGLTTALLAATSGLRAAQTGIDLVSRNVANATTVGYTRKTVPQTPLIVGGEGQGVRLGDIERQVNARLQVEVRSGLSQTTAYEVRDDFLSRFELVFGKPGDNTTVAHQLHQLSDAFRQLSTNPDVITTQTTVISRAEAFASGLNVVADSRPGPAHRGRGPDQDLGRHDQRHARRRSTTSTARSPRRGRSAKARPISRIGATPSSTTCRRKSISATSPVRTARSGSRPRAATRCWTSRIHTVSFNNIAQLTPQLAYPLGLDGIMIDGTDVTTSLTGGRLKGLFDLRDTILPQAQLQLDSLAASVTTLLTGEDLELFNDAGVAFNPISTTGYANRIAVNQVVRDEPWRTRDGTVVAVQNTNTGDTTLPLAIIDMFESLQTFPGYDRAGHDLHARRVRFRIRLLPGHAAREHVRLAGEQVGPDRIPADPAEQ